MRTITRLAAANRRASRTSVELDGEPWAEIDSEVVLRHGLERGLALSDAEVEELERDDAFVRARRAAAILLKTRPRSAAELSQRLLGRRFDEPTVDRTLAYFTEKGDLDDARFARLFAAHHLGSRKLGPIRVAHALRRLGVEDGYITAALEAEPAAGEEEQLVQIRRLIARRMQRMRDLDPARRRQKLHAALARAGFAPSVFRDALDEALGSEERFDSE